MSENRKDLENAKGKIPNQMYKRLGLGEKKYVQLLKGVSGVIGLNDPVGIVTLHRELHDGLNLKRVACPIGVLCVIFEARPEAAVQIASLALKSGNAVILKGGSEANLSNRALVSAMREALKCTDVPEDTIQLVSSRQDVHHLLKLDEYIDLVIPRGSRSLVRKIQQSTRIPVMGHADGICSVYVDEEANVETAVRVTVDSKTNYPAACNACETLLVHHKILEKALIPIGMKLKSRGVTKIHADKHTIQYLPQDITVPSKEQDFRTEFGCLEIAVKCVKSTKDAIDHINSHGSSHTDCIVTENSSTAKQFMNAVDSAGVYHNASTRFADGFRYGFGAEVGVSTNRLHARGPVGMEGLLTYKYKLSGKGHIVEEFGVGKKEYTHRDVQEEKKRDMTCMISVVLSVVVVGALCVRKMLS